MSKVGGGRNYGYGKNIQWAGKNALKDRYGEGHYGTVAAHAERWQRFVNFLKSDCRTKDARDITQYHIEQYGQHLKQQVNAGSMKVAYAQNLLSSVNVVLSVLRSDKQLIVSPSQLVGERTVVRSQSPVTLNQHPGTDASNTTTVQNSQLTHATHYLKTKDEQRVLMTAALCRTFGLRFKEASLLNISTALKQSRTLGRINITAGTKGGRGKHADRWVPVTERGIALLTRAHNVLDQQNNLIPKQSSYIQWRNHAYSQWRLATTQTEIKGFHDLRAAYACERYQQITGNPAPVVNGIRIASKDQDQHARTIIALELGHNRTNVLVAYLGTAK
jgi:predicted Zn-ribbon and HTH transcriptional regulator